MTPYPCPPNLGCLPTLAICEKTIGAVFAKLILIIVVITKPIALAFPKWSYVMFFLRDVPEKPHRTVVNLD